MSTHQNAQVEKGNMQVCLNAGKEGEHACQHCNGDKNVLPIYYSGNPNYEGPDAKWLSQGAQDGCAKSSIDAEEDAERAWWRGSHRG